MTFRDDVPACASCGATLAHVQTRLICEACGGTMVGEAELAGMLAELAPEDARPLADRLVRFDAPVRACPRCGKPMTAGALSCVAVHRCAAHGAWFDRGGLEQALRASAYAGTADAARAQLADYRARGAYRAAVVGAPVVVIGIAAAIPVFAALGVVLCLPLAVLGVRRLVARR